MLKNKPHLIILSYYDPGSGFFTVIFNLTKALQRHFTIHFIGIGYSGDIRQEYQWILYPGNIDSEDFAAKSCFELAHQLGSGTILIINDLWITSIYKPFLSPLKSDWSIFAYTAIDGHVLDTNIVRDIEFLDRLVVYTEFAKAEINRLALQSNNTPSPINTIPVEVIAHGTDSAFYKIDSAGKKMVRSSLFKNNQPWQNAFIILNANKISERKRIDLTLKAFHIFANDKHDVRLYLHHSHITQDYHTRLHKKLEALGLTDKVLINPARQTLMSKQELNKLYNACDIGINTSTGEGWGLVSFEHAATGAAQIVPDHSACSELWKDVAEMIPTKSNYQVKDRPDTLMREIDVSKAVDAMNKYYQNREYMQLMAEKAYAMVNKEQFKWDFIGQQWVELLMSNKL